MLRTHHCGALNEKHSNEEVTLSGWVQKVRNKGFIVWIDIRDRYGITQLVLTRSGVQNRFLKNHWSWDVKM
jgi:aspartyl-tRNA synthetase